jgi:hypothetical protein
MTKRCPHCPAPENELCLVLQAVCDLLDDPVARERFHAHYWDYRSRFDAARAAALIDLHPPGPFPVPLGKPCGPC